VLSYIDTCGLLAVLDFSLFHQKAIEAFLVARFGLTAKRLCLRESMLL
jgi:hypothetical protein